MSSKVEYVHRYIYRSIRSGRFVEKIPTEAELCQLFDASRFTVRAAIKQLVDLGFLIPRKGAGVFVNRGVDFHLERKLISSVVGEVRSSYFCAGPLSLLAAIMQSVFRHRSLYLSLDETVGGVDKLADMLPQIEPDGLLWLTPRYERIVPLLELNIPIVAVWALVDQKNRCERVDYDTEISGVFIDRFQEGGLYATHCLERGFNNLLVVRPSNGREWDGDQFFQGVISTLNERGLDPARNLTHLTLDKINYSRVNRALKNGLTGVYSSDLTMKFFQDFFKESGMCYGKDYLLLARGESHMTSLNLYENCEYIDFPMEKMAFEAVNMLLKRIETDESEPEQVLIPARIISCEENSNFYLS